MQKVSWRAIFGAVWNHYRRAASDVNIFNFFNGRTVLDGRNCPKTRPGGASGRTRRPRPGATSATIFIESSKNAENFPRGRGARAARVFFFYFISSTKGWKALREGLCSQGASCAVCGSGVPPYDFLNVYGVFNSRFSIRNG